MSIELIVAFDDKRGIAKDGVIPWIAPEDRALFKKLTSGHVVVVGRKTYDTLPNSLFIGRAMYVLSRNAALHSSNSIFKYSPEQALWLSSWQQVFIAGGLEIYNLFLPYASILHISKIKGDYGCDQFFPALNEKNLTVIKHQEYADFEYTCFGKPADTRFMD